MSIAGAREHLRAAENWLWDAQGRLRADSPERDSVANGRKELLQAFNELSGPCTAVPVTVGPDSQAKATVAG